MCVVFFVFCGEVRWVYEFIGVGVVSMVFVDFDVVVDGCCEVVMIVGESLVGCCCNGCGCWLL